MEGRMLWNVLLCVWNLFETLIMQLVLVFYWLQYSMIRKNSWQISKIISKLLYPHSIDLNNATKIKFRVRCVSNYSKFPILDSTWQWYKHIHIHKIITNHNIEIYDIVYWFIHRWPVYNLLMLSYHCQKSLRCLVTNKTV